MEACMEYTARGRLTRHARPEAGVPGCQIHGRCVVGACQRQAVCMCMDSSRQQAVVESASVVGTLSSMGIPFV